MAALLLIYSRPFGGGGQGRYLGPRLSWATIQVEGLRDATRKTFLQPACKSAFPEPLRAMCLTGEGLRRGERGSEKGGVRCAVSGSTRKFA